MPRSVPHPVDGGQLRVWQTRDDWVHVKLDVTREHDGEAFDVDARWDIPPKAEPWLGLGSRARDGDAEAAEELATAMFAEAVSGDG